MKFGLFFRITHQSKMHTIIHPILNASNLTNQYISYSMALFSPNEIRTLILVMVVNSNNVSFWHASLLFHSSFKNCSMYVLQIYFLIPFSWEHFQLMILYLMVKMQLINLKSILDRHPMAVSWFHPGHCLTFREAISLQK